MRGVLSECREGRWQCHGKSRRSYSPEVRNKGGARVPGRVPQRGGNNEGWIDVRPQRRKKLRHEHLGQDRSKDF